jgi:DNA-binding LacI/PurR family transcriptional regulator
MSPKVTITDLAKEFDVDKATISRALRGKAGVSDALRRKIMKRARELKFFANAQARGLATGQTEALALVFCDETSYFLTNPFYSGVLAGIAGEADRLGFTLAFCSLSAEAYEPGNELPKVLREHRADGFLFVGDQDDRLIEEARDMNYPLLLVDHALPDKSFYSVIIDNRGGAREAVEHLASLGHRRIAFISGPLKSPSFSERLEGYRSAVEELGLEQADYLVQCVEEEPGYNGMRRVLEGGEQPDAVFAANDTLAVMAMKALREKGLSVPDDISVMGFDDSRSAVEIWPTLTTMHVDMAGMGRLAVQHLVSLVRGEDAGATSVVIHPEVLVRESTRAV